MKIIKYLIMKSVNTKHRKQGFSNYQILTEDKNKYTNQLTEQN